MSTQMHRSLCRAGFVLFCLLPTVLVGGWILWPDSTATWKNKLASRFGLDVSIQRVSSLRPRVMLLEQVALIDIETGALASAERIEINASDEGTVIIVPHLVVAHDQLRRVYELIHDRILRQRRPGESRVVVQAKSVALVGPADAATRTIHDLSFTLDDSRDGVQAVLSFRATDQQGDRIEMAVERSSQTDQRPSTRWMLSTGDGVLPCSVLNADVPALTALGDECQFSGRIYGQQTSEGWTGDISGRFIEIDLRRLVADQFPHEMSGRAELELKRARIENGRLINAAGTVKAKDGTVGVTLLVSSANHLKLRQVRALLEETAAYDKLHFGFEIDGFALTIGGHCDNSGTMMTDKSGAPLLVESATPRVNVLALVRTLVPVAEFAVPLTVETAPLLSFFPVPPAKSDRR